MEIRKFYTFFYLLVVTPFIWVTPAQAISWNPLKWFDGEDDDEDVVVVATPEEQAAAKEMFDRAVAYQFEGREGRAADLYEEITEDYPFTDVVPEAMFNWAGIYAETNRFKKAFTLLQSIILVQPQYEGFDNVIAEQFEIATRIMEGEREKLFGTIPIFRYYTRAIQYFQVIARNAPYSEYAPLSLMNIAILGRDLEKEVIAVDALDQLINFYPDHELAPEAYFLLAEVFSSLIDGPNYDQGSTREAISYYEDFLILFPDSPRVPEAEQGLAAVEEVFAQSKFLMGDYYLRHIRNETAALTLYNETITVAPNSETAKRAQERIDRIRARAIAPVIGVEGS